MITMNLSKKVRGRVEKCSLQLVDMHSDRFPEDTQACCAELSVTEELPPQTSRRPLPDLLSGREQSSFVSSLFFKLTF